MKLHLRILLSLFLAWHAGAAWGGELLLSGVYHGSNLYVQNPHDGNNNFCVQDVYVNGKKHMDPPKASVFTIDLSGFAPETPLKIEIYHRDNCEPKVINPNAIRVKEEFQFVFLNVDDHALHWQAKGEKKMGKYFVEKFEHNNWSMEQAVDGRGAPGGNEYRLPVRHHAGNNRYRIKYLEVSGRSYYSDEVHIESAREVVDFYPKKVADKLSFTSAVDYEIRDAYGSKVLEGHGQTVDCASLKPGLYYVSFENRTEKFFKK
jgi:hypothetical protein